MSIIINTRRNVYRLKLLCTVSAVALVTFGMEQANADDGDRTPIWLEVGWHFDRIGGGNELFAPPFVTGIPAAGLISPLSLEKAMSYAYGGEAQMSFQPSNSDWTFSASVRYGRSHSRRQVHEERTLPPEKFPVLGRYVTRTAIPNFDDISASNHESHAIVDFQAGKDLGLGIFGHDNASRFDIGIRFAQFNSSSDDTIYARADSHYSLVPFTLGSKYFSFPLPFHHTYSAHSHMERNFKGIGPSITWKNATTLLGEPQDGQLTLDWSANAALLFGRQRTVGQHHTTARYYYYNPKYAHSTVHTAAAPNRSRNAVVPNVGGSLGVSYRIEDFKISLGYRADVFFNALDGGIDARKSYDRGFYGPFASVSIGLGD